jgi:tetrapyrrole methylase family protein/MazG family protein
MTPWDLCIEIGGPADIWQRSIGAGVAQLVEGPWEPGIIVPLIATGDPQLSQRFQKLTDLMAALRAPNGCPWDRKQTHESLKPYLLEETYEVLETIDHQDRRKLSEELGDVLLQVLFHSQIASEAGAFTIDDVLDRLADKLVRRHPHVFPNGSQDPLPANADQVLAKWEDIKRAERQAEGRPESVLDGVPQTLPALLRAYQIQGRASRVGFDWSHDQTGFDQVLVKIEEEIRELRTALRQPLPDEARHREIDAEFGDVLFSLVNLARFVKVNPEDALRQAVSRFVTRFQYIERQAAGAGRVVGELSLDEMNRLWEEAKQPPPATETRG